MTHAEHKSESTGGEAGGSARGSGAEQADAVVDSDRSVHDFACLRCGHLWRAHRRNAEGEPIAPAQCARCRSAYWNVAPDAKSTRARRPGDPRWPTPPTSTERRAAKKAQAQETTTTTAEVVEPARAVVESRTPLGPPRMLSTLVPPPPLSAISQTLRDTGLEPLVTRTPIVPPPPRPESEPQPETTFKPSAPILKERSPAVVPMSEPSPELAAEADRREQEALDAPAD